jgi:uncharacterized protein YggE
MDLGKRHWWALASCAVGLMIAGAAQAQMEAPEGMNGAVTGTGTSTLKVAADLVRVQLAIEAQGKDLKEALAKLKTMETADNEKLAGVGVAAGAIQWSEATPGVVSDQQQKMIQMARMRHQGVNAAAEPVAPVKVTAMLKADVTLGGKNNEEILTAVETLRDKIKKLSLGATAGPSTMPADAEAQEEAEEETGERNNGEAVPPGTAMFIYVHKITEADHDKAAGEAFANAKKEAVRLAKAAGVEIGAIKSLSGRTGPAVDPDEMYNGYNGGGEQRYIYMMMQQQYRSGAQVDETYAPRPGDLAFQVSVSAAFTIR